MSRSHQLEMLAKEIRKCMECKKHKIGLPVVGEGSITSGIMFIGEAPGIEESRTGRPFVGRAGKFLDGLISSIRIKREEIYITSPIKYYPGRRPLRKNEILHGRVHLLKQLDIIDPKLIVTIGRVALFALFKRYLKVEEIHGRELKWNDKLVFPTFHPAAAMRFSRIRRLTRDDFRKLRRLLKRTYTSK